MFKTSQTPSAVLVFVFSTCRFGTQLEVARFLLLRVHSNSNIYPAIFVYIDSLSELEKCGAGCCTASTA